MSKVKEDTAKVDNTAVAKPKVFERLRVTNLSTLVVLRLMILELPLREIKIIYILLKELKKDSKLP